MLESFIISCWLLKGKKIGIGIGIGQFARKKSVSESATKNHDRCITSKQLTTSNYYYYNFILSNLKGIVYPKIVIVDSPSRSS